MSTGPASGVNARTVTDVKLLNSLFSDGPKQYREVEVNKLRLGYPINFWRDIGQEVGPKSYCRVFFDRQNLTSQPLHSP